LTKDNINNPNINFDAGRLSAKKKLRDNDDLNENDGLFTFLIDLEKKDIVTGPLEDRRHTENNEKDVFKFLKDLNKILPQGEKLDEDILKDSFKNKWGEFQKRLNEIIEKTETPPKKKIPNEIMNEKIHYLSAKIDNNVKDIHNRTKQMHKHVFSHISLSEYYEKIEIAKWERSDSELVKDFWVIMPQFLGEDDEFFEAMVENLNNGVRYIYFFFQQEDIWSLSKLYNRLKGRLSTEILEAKLIKFVYVNCDKKASKLLNSYFFEGRLFIKNPTDPNKREGFRLHSLSEGESDITGGYKIDNDGITNIVDRYLKLKNFFEPLDINDVNFIGGDVDFGNTSISKNRIVAST